MPEAAAQFRRCWRRVMNSELMSEKNAANAEGLTLMAAANLTGALAAFDRALAADPQFPEALTNRGTVFLRMGRYREALDSASAAVLARPDFAIGHFNLGRTFAAMNRVEDAIASYDRVLMLKPGDAEALWAKGTVQILAGNFREGWSNYDARWRTPSFAHPPRDFGTPKWTGTEPLAGKTIFVHGEQGFGDTIQFCRYLPLLATRGARVVFMAQPELRGLLAASSLKCELFVPGDAVPKFDFDIPLMTLPAAFATTVETVPAATPYLSVPVDKAARWDLIVDSPSRRRVGLAWSGRRSHRDDHLRSLQIEMLAPLFAIDAEFHVLQTDMTDAERRFLAGRARLFDLPVRDFGDAAAHVAATDLVITVDTSIAHLAGALGKPVWILLAHAPDFRWMLNRADSPWYPTARLLRQPDFGAWDQVVEEVVRRLRGG